jgi:hypothetical protein
VAPLAALLGEPRFLHWLRPWAYDALTGRRHGDDTDSPSIATLVASVPKAVLERAVERDAPDPGDDGARYCPRCTRTYVATVASCAHCDDLALIDGAES